ncbi:hypothetical protein Taro_021771 [Colocasia esculenta]|uniref:Uncharacterized protein n=1 Tax=Colocasia esculenta TaxID=4460 RepID=A0A843VCH8_COLES|nr:hypothetical protein [Colocasia esculenta]
MASSDVKRTRSHPLGPAYHTAHDHMWNSDTDKSVPGLYPLLVPHPARVKRIKETGLQLSAADTLRDFQQTSSTTEFVARSPMSAAAAAMMAGKPVRSTCFLFLFLLSLTPSSSASVAHPSYDEAAASCGPAHEEVPSPVRREVYDGGRIIDISHRYVEDMPSWESADGLGQFLWLRKSMKNGSLANNSEMKLPSHTGTHVDAPGHVFQHYFEAGFDVDTLDLAVLNGPALLVDVPRDTNITAEVMKSLAIPKGIKRVLFRTLNTDRKLMFKKEFDASYVGFMKDGAQWLVDNTDIKLVGKEELVPTSHYMILSDNIFAIQVTESPVVSLFVLEVVAVEEDFTLGKVGSEDSVSAWAYIAACRGGSSQQAGREGQGDSAPCGVSGAKAPG